MYQPYDLLSATMIAKTHNIKLEKIILVGFIFLFPLQPNVATEQPNDETSYIKVTKFLLGENGYLFGFRGNIIDWIGTSIYNHYTKHNSRKTGLYHGKYFIYGGIKINITKNVYLDVYYSLLKLIPFYIIDVKIISQRMLDYWYVSLLTISINIRINKKFYI